MSPPLAPRARADAPLEVWECAEGGEERRGEAVGPVGAAVVRELRHRRQGDAAQRESRGQGGIRGEKKLLEELDSPIASDDLRRGQKRR